VPAYVSITAPSWTTFRRRRRQRRYRPFEPPTPSNSSAGGHQRMGVFVAAGGGGPTQAERIATPCCPSRKSGLSTSPCPSATPARSPLQPVRDDGAGRGGGLKKAPSLQLSPRSPRLSQCFADDITRRGDDPRIKQRHSIGEAASRCVSSFRDQSLRVTGLGLGRRRSALTGERGARTRTLHACSPVPP